MEYIGYDLNSMFLCHHGVLGMKWGIRRYQNRDGSLTAEGYKRYANKNLQKAKTSNMDKWGKDEDHNILYIVGYSGSGKSTTAISLSKPNDKIIHLDAYSEPDTEDTATIRNKDFDAYLDKRVKNWRQMANATSTGVNGTMKKYSEEYWNIVNSFRKALEDYGKAQFSNRNRVIVEGIQIADGWLIDDKKYYNNKPIVILGTNPVSSIKRAFERDDRGGIIKGLKNLDSAKEYVQWYFDMSKDLNTLVSNTQSKRGQDWVKEYLKRNK